MLTRAWILGNNGGTEFSRKAAVEAAAPRAGKPLFKQRKFSTLLRRQSYWLTDWVVQDDGLGRRTGNKAFGEAFQAGRDGELKLGELIMDQRTNKIITTRLRRKVAKVTLERRGSQEEETWKK